MAQAPKPTGVIIKSEFPSLRLCILPPSFYDEFLVCVVSRYADESRYAKLNYAIELCAQVVGTPHLDELLDGFAIVEFFVEHFAGERGEFGVAGKAQ
jgi:hypothetical protein